MTQPVQTQWIELSVDGHPMEAYVAKPAGEGPWPAVLVLMEIFGVNDYVRQITERIAAKGYVALAYNYYHRSTPNLELSYTDADIAEGLRHKDQTTHSGLYADARAAIEYLKTLPEVSPHDAFGSVGFCFGGYVAYLLATLPEIKATASFYGVWMNQSSANGDPPVLSMTPKIHGEILCLFGDQDPLIPPQDVADVEHELAPLGNRAAIVRYPDGGHGFCCHLRPDYHPASAEDAWQRVEALFSRVLSGQAEPAVR